MTVGGGMGTSGSLGIWMSLLKYSMSEARRKKFLRLQWNRETGHRGAISPLSNHALFPHLRLVPVKLFVEPVPVALQGVRWET